MTIKTHPLPYVELAVDVENLLPRELQIYGINVEIWLGKPVVQFYSFLSESLRPGETRKGLRAYNFLNEFQCGLLNPNTKDSVPPNVTLIYTLSCRSFYGPFEKTVKSTWIAPKVLPTR
ncbi:MAG: hypothetical protein R3A11_02610 [Bdellovibrionota bacterium]